MADRVNILAFDTSTQACSVALLSTQADASPLIFASHRIAPMQHTQLILPMIDALLSEANLNLADLTAVAVGVGPGSFTGCRLGVSVAQALGFAHSLPLVPVSSMAALALSVFMTHGHQRVLVGLDARTEQVYWGGYHVTEGGAVSCIISEQVRSVNDLVWPENEQWVAVGDAWKPGGAPDILITDAYPTGTAVANLGLALYQRGVCCSPAALEPSYLR